MKTLLIAFSLGTLCCAAAAGDAHYYSPEITALRGECAAKYYANEYRGKDAYAKDAKDAYSKDSYDKGSYGGAKSECSEQQYASYLETADPARVMAAYPSAAGKPGYKKDATAKPYKPDGDPDAGYDKSQGKDEKGYDKK